MGEGSELHLFIHNPSPKEIEILLHKKVDNPMTELVSVVGY
jgi:hypothetical protein